MRALTRVGCVSILATFSATAAAATPAHYVVFTVGADGRFRADFYTQVELAGTDDGVRSSGNAVAMDADHAERRVAYHAFRDGVDLGERTVEMPKLRAEFAHDPEHGDGRIESFPATQRETSFVLRIPLDAADAVEFTTTKGAKQHFDFAQLAVARNLLPASANMRINFAASASNPANRVDMLLLGDGYTNAQQAQFDADAQVLHDAFFGMTPYKEYASFVNWTTGFVASNQSGADHPPYQAGCTTSACCADAEAQTDILAGQFVDTAFDATFCTAQIHRLVTVNGSKVFTAAAAYPNWDKIIVVVNDPIYGGSGGSFSATTTNASASQIVLHEYGHSFSRLADEYSSPYPGYPACSDISGSAHCEPNVTDQTSAAQVKWSSWFNPSNPIPTPTGHSGVGLFQGARYLASGMYRPVDTQCIMQYLGMPFCPVCAQAYVLRLYTGGWGTPANGIDLIEPGSESPATTATVNYSLGKPQVFQADLLQPTIGSLGVQWYLDGNPIGGANAPSYSFSANSLTPPTHTLELRVTDQSTLVKPAMAGNLLVHNRIWTIKVTDQIFKDGFQ